MTIMFRSNNLLTKRVSIMDMAEEENIEWLMESSKTVENSGETHNYESSGNENNELRNFLQVLRLAFESEPIVFGTKVKGIVNSEEELQKLIKRLKALGYFFSIRTSDKKSKKNNCKLMVAKEMSDLSTHPYIVISHVHYSCSHKNKEKQKASNPNSSRKLRKYSNCKATMDIRQLELFTNISLAPIKRKRIEVVNLNVEKMAISDLMLELQSLLKLRTSKKIYDFLCLYSQMLRNFRNDLASNVTQPGVLKYSVIISLPQAHNHLRDVKGQYLSDEVKAAMHSIIQSGVTSLRDIQEKLYQIVDEEFSHDSVKPSRENSAFYPNQKTIYNHLRQDGLTLKKIYKRNNDIAELKRKIFDEISCMYNDINKCMDYDQLKKFYKSIKAVRQ